MKKSKENADNRLLGFLGCWTVVTFSIGRLTWWEYSWDIMEPVAWATQAGGMLFWGWYYFVTRNENSMTDLNSRIQDTSFRKKLKRENFSIEKYNELVVSRNRLEKDYFKLQSKL